MPEPSADRSTASPNEAVARARGSAVAAEIRRSRLVIVLRRVSPQSRLLDLASELVAAGARVFEVTMDSEDAPADISALNDLLPSLVPSPTARAWVGAGTVRTVGQLRAAHAAGAAFGVSPVFDREVLREALELGLPFLPGAMTPTEIDAAWRAGAALVKVFPGSSVGPNHVRELRGPLRDIELVVTGGVDFGNAAAFLDAGAAAIGIGSAILRATPNERRALIDAIRRTEPRLGPETTPEAGP